MGIEDEHPDVLQNIELIVATCYRENPEMTDYSAMRVYEALIKRHVAEAAGHTSNAPSLPPLEAQLFESTRMMCEWRLGRGTLDDKMGPTEPSEQTDLETMIRCLRRLVRSVETWNKQGGRQGYLQFMSQFVR
ncbi:MAG: hypothetical protein IT365_19500 [Candidatus Hydrogenedentes bacterium]|nr:hypothetical protein [Candidatus Hydrogenedentota bacterium]